MHPNQKIKFTDWYMKIDPTMWIAADFEYMNVPINDNGNDNDNNNNHVTDKMFVSKPVAIGCNIFNPDYGNFNLEKDSFIKYFGEDCVEWFNNEMLETEGYLKNYFKSELEINFDTVPESFDQSTCWLCENEFKLKGVKKIQLLKTIAI